LNPAEHTYEIKEDYKDEKQRKKQQYLKSDSGKLPDKDHHDQQNEKNRP
jgi:hypothetical protein